MCLYVFLQLCTNTFRCNTKHTHIQPASGRSVVIWDDMDRLSGWIGYTSTSGIIVGDRLHPHCGIINIDSIATPDSLSKCVFVLVAHLSIRIFGSRLFSNHILCLSTSIGQNQWRIDCLLQDPSLIACERHLADLKKEEQSMFLLFGPLLCSLCPPPCVPCVLLFGPLCVLQTMWATWAQCPVSIYGFARVAVESW